MGRVKLEAAAVVMALLFTTAGTAVSEAASTVTGVESSSVSFDASFQVGRTFTVTWGGSTDTQSGVASYSVSVRRAPFNGSFGPWEPVKKDVLVAPVAPVVAAAGDIACGVATSAAADCVEMITSDLLLRLNPSVVLPLGDTQYENGEYNDFLHGRGPGTNTGYDVTWGRLKSLTRPTVGNHEYNDPAGGAKGYYDYFNGIGNFTGPAGDRDKGYYSFDVGNWHLISLNSNCAPVGGCHAGSTQEQWLRRDLLANPRSCTLAYVHQPRWSSEDRSGADHTAIQALFQALYDHGVELLLAGHSHFYERFAPQDPNRQADPIRGVRQIIVGTGGRDVSPTFTSPIEPTSERLDGETFGALKLTLRPKSYDWEFVPVPGQALTDSGSTACHGLIADTTPPTAPTIRGATPVGSATFVGEPGSTYCFRATATDWEGNTSHPSSEYCTAVPVDNVALKHWGGWIKKLGTGHYLETFSQTRRFGATLNLKGVTAKHLSILVTTCPKCGAIRVFFDGKLVKGIPLRSSTATRLRIIDVKTFDTAQTKTVKIRVASRGKLVRVDGLGISAV